ncbi:MAG: DinB family protein [Bacteroidia bacterium]|nr:DinB family protein [Bacteroidia bacterium]
MEIKSREQLIEGLEKKFSTLVIWIENQPIEKFEAQVRREKWSTGQHLAHLIKSTRPVNLALRLPKFILKWRFGINNREEKTYEALVEKYKQKLAAGGTAPSPFIPPKISANEKKALIAQFNRELAKLKKVVRKWDEKHLSTYIIPHPLLGRITMRELLFFTIYHTEHHLQIIQRDYS